MSEVTRVPARLSGISDAVELRAQCSIARYRTKNSVAVSVKGKPRLHPCKIMASYSEGTVSVSVPETAFSVTVRLDEMMAVLKEAAEASRSVEEILQEERDHAQECAAPQG